MYHYHLPPELEGRVFPGSLVVVPFGPKQVQGVIWRMLDAPEVPETKAVAQLLDPEPVLTPAQLALAEWLARETLAPLAACFDLMLPARAEPAGGHALPAQPAGRARQRAGSALQTRLVGPAAQSAARCAGGRSTRLAAHRTGAPPRRDEAPRLAGLPRRAASAQRAPRQVRTVRLADPARGNRSAPGRDPKPDRCDAASGAGACWNSWPSRPNRWRPPGPSPGRAARSRPTCSAWPRPGWWSWARARSGATRWNGWSSSSASRPR